MSMCRRAFPKKIRRRKTHIPAMDSNASSEADADGPDDVVAYDVRMTQAHLSTQFIHI